MRDGPEGDGAGQAGLVNDLLPDAALPVSGRDHLPGALVDADVVGDAVGVVEEDEAAAPPLAAGHRTEGPELGVRGPRDGQAEVAVDGGGQAGAVEPGLGRLPAPLVPVAADKSRGVGRALLPEARSGGR